MAIKNHIVFSFPALEFTFRAFTRTSKGTIPVNQRFMFKVVIVCNLEFARQFCICLKSIPKRQINFEVAGDGVFFQIFFKDIKLFGIGHKFNRPVLFRYLSKRIQILNAKNIKSRMQANKPASVNLNSFTKSINKQLVFMLIHQQVGVVAPCLFARGIAFHITHGVTIPTLCALSLAIASHKRKKIEIQGHANFSIALTKVKTRNNAHCSYLISFCVFAFDGFIIAQRKQNCKSFLKILLNISCFEDTTIGC